MLPGFLIGRHSVSSFDTLKLGNNKLMKPSTERIGLQYFG